MRKDVATLAGGCFWCLEAVFDDLEGVEDVVSGYAGGSVPNPTYKHVCTGETGHAEVVQVTFNPDVISYRDLLRVFFTIHDPTTLNRQGADVGTQYRSAIFTHNETQEKVAEEVIAELNDAGIWADPNVTRYMGGPRQTETVRRILEEELRNGSVDAFGFCPVVEKTSGRVIGDCGLTKKDVDGRDEVELVYVFAADAWGQGYATEA